MQEHCGENFAIFLFAWPLAPQGMAEAEPRAPRAVERLCLAGLSALRGCPLFPESAQGARTSRANLRCRRRYSGLLRR